MLKAGYRFLRPIFHHPTFAIIYTGSRIWAYLSSCEPWGYITESIT